jgi:phosphoglycerate dehydrogenase-like enzyme
VVGLGAIGKVVRREGGRSEDGGDRVRPYVSKEDANRLGVETLSLDELLPPRDFITFHTP